MSIVPQNSFTQQTFDFETLNLQPVPDPALQVTHELTNEQKYWWSDLEYQHIPRKPGIYAIINILNGHFYIGSAINLYNRKSEHFRNLRNDKHPNPRLQNAYNRDGSDAFRFAIVERVEHAETLIMFEQHYIDNLSPEYNIAPIAGVSRPTELPRQPLAERNVILSHHSAPIRQTLLPFLFSSEQTVAAVFLKVSPEILPLVSYGL